jgi:hypothetical protein
MGSERGTKGFFNGLERLWDSLQLRSERMRLLASLSRTTTYRGRTYRCDEYQSPLYVPVTRVLCTVLDI